MILRKIYKSYYGVFLLSLFFFLLDQLTKLYIVQNVEIGNYSEPYVSFWGDFFQIIHVRNKNLALSIGKDLSTFWRFVFVILLPCFLLIYLTGLLLRREGFNRKQREAMALILGGGLGNIVDRLFRDGVVDFIDFDFWDIHYKFEFLDWQFRMNRWPTFNVADAVMVVGILLLILFTICGRKRSRE